jgi:hypothetical protein
MFAACGVQLYSSKQYGDAMVQRLSAGLAQQIVNSEPLLDNQGKANTENLKSLFDRLMTLNPSVELYVVSPQGHMWQMRPRRAHEASNDRSYPVKQLFIRGCFPCVWR